MPKGYAQKLTLLISCFLIPLSCFAGIRVDFDRDNQTYNWLTGFDYSILKSGFSLRSTFDGQTNLIKGDLNRWQENATAGFKSEMPIRDRLNLITSGEYTVNGLGKRRVRTSELALGFSYRPVNHIEIRPIVHADKKKRSELETQLDEQGIGFGLMGSLRPIDYRGISIGASASYDKKNLSNIPSQKGDAVFDATYEFLGSDTLSISLKGAEATKMYYGASGKVGSITKQIKQEREGNIAFSIRLPAHLMLTFDGNVHLSRYLYRGGDELRETTSIQRDNYGRGGGYELALNGQLRDFARGTIGYRWSKASQDYQGRTLDQDTDIGELSFHGELGISPRDSLSGDMLVGVTSFSNPSIGSDNDDWDKKTILINGRYIHVFSRYFAAGISGGANSFHQIYISGARSANNGQNDTYIMAPFARWRPFGWLAVIQKFDIQANYITFDFDRKKVATKNRIFRRGTSRSEIIFTVSERLRILQGYIYRYEDYGQLIWDDGWQQAVSWDRRRNGIETRITYKPVGIFQITPYFFWEKTCDYDHKVDLTIDLAEPLEIRTLKDEQVKMFFELEMIFRWNHRRSFLVDFSHRLRKFMDRSRETNDYVKVSMEYLF